MAVMLKLFYHILVEPPFHRNTRRSSKLAVNEGDSYFRMPVSSPRDLHYSDYSSICPTDPGIPLSTRTPPYRRSYSLRLDADNPHCKLLQVYSK